MISGIDELYDLADKLASASRVVPKRAADLAAPALLAVAQAEYAAGEAPDGSAWDPLKHGSGAPIRALTSGVTSQAQGARVIVRTPEPTKYHQGGFFVHTDAAGARLKEAKAAAKVAKANADKEGYKRAQVRVRSLREATKSRDHWATHVAARRTLPGRTIPAPWAAALAQAWARALAEHMGQPVEVPS
jgi:hypothetical protein